MEISFANLFYLITRLTICLCFLFVLIGSALNLALQLGVHHDELENVKGRQVEIYKGVLHDALIDVSVTQILFHWIGLKKLAD